MLGCIDDFNNRVPVDFDNLVVEARLTNNNEFTQVYLSKSLDFNEDKRPDGISDAKVMVIENSENTYEMGQIGPEGVYKFITNPPELIDNNAYQLHITLSTGVEYISTPEVYHNPTEFGTLNVDIVNQQVEIDEELTQIPFIQFIDNAPGLNESADTNYYYHDFEGVYAFQSPYQGTDACYPNGTRSHLQAINLTCYQTGEKNLPTNISLLTAENSEGYMMLNIQPGYQFLIGYSLSIRRHRINKSFYEYISNLKTQAEYGGSIFDTPPFKVEGNIKLVSDPSQLALGFFSVEAVNFTDRIFIDRSDISGPVYDNLNSLKCYNNITDPYLSESQLVRPPSSCCDCRLEIGATDTKPDYWPN